MVKRLKLLTLVFVMVLAGWGTRSSAQELTDEAARALVARNGHADMIVVNGKIISVDDAGYNQNPGNIYQAMAVKGDRIMALGTSQRIRFLADSNTKVIDLMGQTVIPGIIETHVHIFGDPALAAQMGLRTPDRGTNIIVQAKKDRETTRLLVENAIKDELQKLPEGDWLRVFVTGNRPEGLSSSMVFAWTAQGDFTPLDQLNRLASKHPLLVTAGTKMNINSYAWDLMKTHFPAMDDYYNARALPDVPEAVKKGVIGVEGMLTLQWSVWWDKQPMSLLADMMRRTLEIAVAHGLTTFSSRLPNPKIIDVYTYLNREADMPIRFAALMEGHRKIANPDTTRNLYTLTGNLTGVGNDYFWFHGVASELWDSDFPTDCFGPDLEAPPNIKKREMCPGPGMLYYDTLRNALASGWRLAGVHGMASHGARIFIQMIESVMKEKGWTVDDVRKLRMTLEHAEAIGKVPDVLEGLKRNGIIVSVHPMRMYSREPDFIRDYGPQAEAFMEPVKSWLDAGIKVVGQIEDYRNVGFQWTILMNRKNVDGKVVLPEEAVDRVTVLKMWTRWASEYVMKEKDLGSLEVGKLADFVVLDKDLLAIPIDEIPSIRPPLTVVGGKIRHLEADYARKLNFQPVGYQFPPNYKPWDVSREPLAF